jgi:hypothetical protein
MNDDAEAYLKDELQRRKAAKQLISERDKQKKLFKPHKLSEEEDKGDILFDEDTQHLYSVLLNKVSFTFKLHIFI